MMYYLFLLTLDPYFQFIKEHFLKLTVCITCIIQVITFDTICFHKINIKKKKKQ